MARLRESDVRRARGIDRQGIETPLSRPKRDRFREPGGAVRVSVLEPLPVGVAALYPAQVRELKISDVRIALGIQLDRSAERSGDVVDDLQVPFLSVPMGILEAGFERRVEGHVGKALRVVNERYIHARFRGYRHLGPLLIVLFAEGVLQSAPGGVEVGNLKIAVAIEREGAVHAGIGARAVVHYFHVPGSLCERGERGPDEGEREEKHPGHESEGGTSQRYVSASHQRTLSTNDINLEIRFFRPALQDVPRPHNTGRMQRLHGAWTSACLRYQSSSMRNE